MSLNNPIPPEEHEMHIERIQHTHHELNLTIEQAKKVYDLEKEKDLQYGEFHFSFWEELDFDLDNYQKILDKEQLKIYSAQTQEHIYRHEAFLKEADAAQLEYINYHNHLVSYYKEKYIPDFNTDDLFIQRKVAYSNDKNKIDYLIAEYKKFLDNSHARILVNHYRHSKLFQPNMLQLAILRSEINHIIPDFWSFKTEMDSATKGVADYLLSAYKHIPDRFKDLFEKKASDLKAFTKNASEKHITPKEGWHTIVYGPTIEQEKENLIMQVLLMDYNQYGLL